VAILRGEQTMAKAYGDDLRRKFLSAYDEGADSLEDLAERFMVSLGWAKKISAQRNRTGQAERVRHQPGRKPRVGAEAEKQVIAWVRAQPDLTLAELSAKLNREASVVLSRGRVWYLVRRLGLRLKKSRSTPENATPKPTSSAVQSSPPGSGRSRRNG
jgi:transposase